MQNAENEFESGTSVNYRPTLDERREAGDKGKIIPASTKQQDGKRNYKYSMDEDEDPDMMCGIGSWRPQCLKIFANIKFAFFLLCASNFLFSFSFSVFIASMTSIQTRYSLQSVLLGLNATLFDTGMLVAVLIVSFLCGRPDSHRPRSIGGGLILGAICLISISFVHFLSEPYNYSTVELGTNDTTMCLAHDSTTNGESDTDTTSCSSNDEQESMMTTVWMLLAHTLVGIFYTPMIILSPTYIDDGFGNRKAPLYLGIYYGMYTLGPVVGFPFASVFVGKYVDFNRVDMSTIDIDPYDTRWVGAWWLGFIVEGVLSLAVAIPLVLLPKKLPLPPETESDIDPPKLKDDYEDEDETKMRREALSRIREFPVVIWKLFTNVPLISVSIGYALECAISSGMMTYFTLYMELQFRISASKAALLTVIALVVSSSLGIFAGGFIMRRFKMAPVAIAKVLVILGIITAILPIPVLFLGCETDTFAGVSVPYKERIILNDTVNATILRNEDFSSLDSSPLTSSCNQNCGCSQSDYDPVCGSDGVTYYSPCYAGCTETVTSTDFSSCTCVGSSTDNDLQTPLSERRAISGICGEQCNSLLAIFVTLCFIFTFVAGLPMAAYVVLPLRIVDPTDKPFAVGVRQLFAQVLGWVPTPIYMGYLIDSSCIYWETSECSLFSICWVYDLYNYRLKLMLFVLILKGIALIMYLITWLALRNATNTKKSQEIKTKEINLNEVHNDGYNPK